MILRDVDGLSVGLTKAEKLSADMAKIKTPCFVCLDLRCKHQIEMPNFELTVLFILLLFWRIQENNIRIKFVGMDRKCLSVLHLPKITENRPKMSKNRSYNDYLNLVETVYSKRAHSMLITISNAVRAYSELSGI